MIRGRRGVAAAGTLGVLALSACSPGQAPSEAPAGPAASGPVASGQGASGQGASGQGASGQGASGQGASGQGASGQGASGQGASGQGASGQGASGQGASARPGSGRPADAAPATPAPEAPPAAATRAGALAFVDYFWRTYNYAYATYDIEPLRAASDRLCSVCAGIEGDVQKLATSGIRVSGYQMAALSSSAPGEVTTGTQVSATLRQTPGRALSAAGETTELPGFRSMHSTITVTWDGSAWRVTSVESDGDSIQTW